MRFEFLRCESIKISPYTPYHNEFCFRRLNTSKYEEGKLFGFDVLVAQLQERQNEECYLSHFSYPQEAFEYFQRYRNLNGKNSIAGYRGPCYAERIYFDIDSKSHDEAIISCRRLIECLLSLGFLVENLDVWFSGRRGFHIGINTSPWGLVPDINFNSWCKEICCDIADGARVEIDRSIYSKISLLRAPFSRHPETGLFKNPIPIESILDCKISGRNILEICRIPIAWTHLPTPSVPSVDLKSRFNKVLKKNLTKGNWPSAVGSESRYPPFDIDWNGIITWPYWNETFFRLAVLAKIKGLSAWDCEQNLRLIRGRNEAFSKGSPVFLDTEIKTIVRSVYQREFSYHVSLKNDPAIKGLIIYPRKGRIS